jgi:hypothetical protein
VHVLVAGRFLPLPWIALHRELERGLPVGKRVAIDLVDVAPDVLGVARHV